MTDLATLFKDGPPERGSYLSRVFGIFSEEIVRIWAADPRSPYKMWEHRPTLYDNEKRYTLDFLFVKDGHHFVSEMKCEVQYQNYRYWRLNHVSQLDHHKKKKAFELFLRLSKDSSAVPVKAGQPLQIEGTVLVWGAATVEGIRAIKDHYGIRDILTIEKCISDLVTWENERYFKLLGDREDWASALFRKLRIGS